MAGIQNRSGYYVLAHEFMVLYLLSVSKYHCCDALEQERYTSYRAPYRVYRLHSILTILFSQSYAIVVMLRAFWDPKTQWFISFHHEVWRRRPTRRRFHVLCCFSSSIQTLEACSRTVSSLAPGWSHISWLSVTVSDAPQEHRAQIWTSKHPVLEG